MIYGHTRSVTDLSRNSIKNVSSLKKKFCSKLQIFGSKLQTFFARNYKVFAQIWKFFSKLHAPPLHTHFNKNQLVKFHSSKSSIQVFLMNLFELRLFSMCVCVCVCVSSLIKIKSIKKYLFMHVKQFLWMNWTSDVYYVIKNVLSRFFFIGWWETTTTPNTTDDIEFCLDYVFE